MPLQLAGARLADLRDPGQCARLGVEPEDTAARWREDRAAGSVPSSWAVADRARDAGADGMLYRSRRMPERWHLALFCWNVAGGPSLKLAGPPVALSCDQSTFSPDVS